jgi:hypothetical protein
MLSSTDAANSVNDASSPATVGVSIWPGASAEGAPVSSGVGAWEAAQGGVRISPGVHGSPAKVVKPSTHIKTVAAASFFKFFMLSPLSFGFRYGFSLKWQDIVAFKAAGALQMIVNA